MSLFNGAEQTIIFKTTVSSCCRSGPPLKAGKTRTFYGLHEVWGENKVYVTNPELAPVCAKYCGWPVRQKILYRIMCSFYPRNKPQVLVNIVKRRVVVKKYCISCIPQSAGFLGSVALSYTAELFAGLSSLSLCNTQLQNLTKLTGLTKIKQANFVVLSRAAL